MRESAIQTKIKKELQKRGWLVVKILQCTQNGWPDLQAHKEGKTAFVETKAPGKQPTDLQLYVHSQLRKHGFEVVSAATSVEDINHL